MDSIALPITPLLPAVRDSLAAHPRLVLEAPPGAGGLLFLPYLSGERTPHMNPEARGALLGLTGRHGRCEIARAVLEGVTFACYDAFSVLAELGAHPAAVVLAGGGAASRVWQQIVADVFGLPVRPLAVSEQSALGAAILAGAGLDWFDAAEAARAWASYGDETAPDPARPCDRGIMPPSSCLSAARR